MPDEMSQKVSLELYQNDGYQIKMENNQIINCILPLVTFKEKDLRPLLQHPFFSLLMTFNVCQTVDQNHDSAYFALLSKFFVYLVD